MMNNSRDKAVDVASGISLLIMILGHGICFYPTKISLSWVIDYFWFFLPFFFYRTGFMYKKRRIVETISIESKKLLVPYVAFSFAGILVSAIITPPIFVGKLLNDLVTMGAVSANLPLWFLPVLLCIKVIMQILLKSKKSYVVFIMLLCIVWFLNGREPYQALPTYCRNIPIGLLTAYAGYVSRGIVGNKYLLYFSLLAYMLLVYFTENRLNLFSGTSEGSFFIGFLINIVGCVGIHTLSKQLVNLKWSHKLEWFGRESMIYLCSHWFIMICMGAILNRCGIYNSYYILFMSFVCVLFVCPYIRKAIVESHIGWIIGYRRNA